MWLGVLQMLAENRFIDSIPVVSFGILFITCVLQIIANIVLHLIQCQVNQELDLFYRFRIWFTCVSCWLACSSLFSFFKSYLLGRCVRDSIFGNLVGNIISHAGETNCPSVAHVCFGNYFTFHCT